ncbi:carboxylating nicotinate-nucleotide diphosphorylase [halophilic archaeon]|nr:carboxylating nicotinate-nucleotide diphosphorylase [halophilic archaeon]
MIQTRMIEQWLSEDVGHHDVTNHVPGDTDGQLVAKEDGIVAGLNAAIAVFEYLDVTVDPVVDPGDRIGTGDVVLRVDGAAREILRGERVTVNLVGHASGVATATRNAVDAARNVTDEVRIAATRKTTPGLRSLEKRAVAVGGGDTHRLTLSHMVMVKDNHIQEMGLKDAIKHFLDRSSFSTKIEVEVENPDDAVTAADAGADIVLLDNMDPAAVKQAVELIPDTVLAEASGGIRVADIPQYATTGVDIISLGELTHSASAIDYSFQTQ